MISSLQIGSGKPSEAYRSPEWVNIDLIRHRRRGHFLQANGCRMPFRSGQFSTVHAIHVLEHLPRDAHIPMLSEIRRVLSPSGVAFIEVPDFLSVVRLLVSAADAGDFEEARIRTVGVYGKGRTSGDFHHWGFLPSYLRDRIHEAGMRCERDYRMISGHYRQEPVILYRCHHDGQAI